VFVPTGQNVGETQEIGLPLLWLALLIWPLDIALRRLFLRRSDFQSLPAWLRLPRRRASPQPGVTPTTISRLQTARTRVRGPQQRSQHEQRNPARPAPADASAPADSTGAPATSRQPASPQSDQPAASQSKPQSASQAKPQSASQPGSATQSDDALARLLVAKQRARRRRERSEGEE
jgi:hypothetical protein